MSNFADRLIDATRRKSVLCVGIDPHPASIPALFGDDPIVALRDWCEAIVEVAAAHVGVIKIQIGLFEPFGPEGLKVFQTCIEQARSLGVVVISDAKRGDIGSTAQGYAEAYLGQGAAFESDAVTLNPYMGRDSLAPFVDMAVANGKGVAILGRTSNPGASDIQLMHAGTEPMFHHVVKSYADDTRALLGVSGWSSLMWVVGATDPAAVRAVRALSPNALFLVPGFGAQGGTLTDAVAGFVRDSGANRLEGGVINASRSVTAPHDVNCTTSFEAWRRTIDTAISDTKRMMVEACALD